MGEVKQMNQGRVGGTYIEDRYDLIIIGAGPGGYTAAIQAASFGMKVAVVEKERLGGACLNTGCIPAKALLYASSFYQEVRQAGRFGVVVDHPGFDFGRMQDYKDQSVDEYRDQIKHLFLKHHITYIKGKALLHKDNVVEVVRSAKYGNGEDTWGRAEGSVNKEEGSGASVLEYYRSRYILLAVGAEPIIPPIPGIHLPQVMTSQEILRARKWEFDRLLIIGGGVIGVEVAAIFAALGSRVTLAEKTGRLLGTMDPEISDCLEESLRERGIKVCCCCSVMELREREDGRVRYAFHENGTWGEDIADRVLTAVGRRPDLSQVLAEDCQVQVKDGRPVLKGTWQTTQEGVYAVGDMVARLRLAHVAASQAAYVAEHLAGKGHRMQLSVVPNGMFVELPVAPTCIYTSPEIAAVGFTEDEARTYHMKVRCGKAFMKENGRAIIARETTGFIRLLFEAYSDTLVGAQMMCPRATDLIGEMATAIANGLTSAQLSMAMRAHPTFSEAVTAAIEDARR